jgi:nucleotide-binding universal stress UspA family protein
MHRALIVIDGSENDQGSLACAVRVCQATKASLTVAVAQVPHRNLADFAFAPGLSSQPGDIVAHARAAFDDIRSAVGEAEFVVYDAEGSRILGNIGHAFDILIVERISDDEGPEIDALNAALFETGRPVLVTPPGKPPALGRRIAAAWNGTAQASRAIASAMWLLREAEEVVLLLGSDMDPGPPLPMVDYLTAHGVAIRLQTYASGQFTARGRGRALLKAAEESGCDMLVTGAYGAGEDGLSGLGRATQKVVTGARIPVLLQS